MKKRLLSAALVLVLLSSLIMPAAAAERTFSDVSGHWAEDIITAAYERNVIDGFPDGTFRPNATVTRAQTAALLSGFFGLTASGTVAFTDVTPGDWFYDAVAALVYGGYVTGIGDGTFRPNNNITRLHVLLILSRILGSPEADDLNVLNRFADANQVRDASQESVNAAAFFIGLGVLRGFDDQTLRPNTSINRVELLALMFRIWDLIEDGTISFEGMPELEEEYVPLAPAPTPTPAPPAQDPGATVPARPVLTVPDVQPPQNMSRATGWDHVVNAGRFTMYVFSTREDANAATVATARSLAVAWAEFPATGERINTDPRMITFEGHEDSEFLRDLPEGWTPAGLGASAPALGSDQGRNTTNLVPGQYLIRVIAHPTAEAAAGGTQPSISAAPPAAANQSWFNIAMGPDELRAYIESRIDDVGTTLRIVDVRNNTEARDEGWLWGTDVAFAGNVGGITPHEANLLAPVGGDTARRGEITLVVY